MWVGWFFFIFYRTLPLSLPSPSFTLSRAFTPVVSLIITLFHFLDAVVVVATQSTVVLTAAAERPNPVID